MTGIHPGFRYTDNSTLQLAGSLNSVNLGDGTWESDDPGKVREHGDHLGLEFGEVGGRE
jgi:hypothetical protein